MASLRVKSKLLKRVYKPLCDLASVFLCVCDLNIFILPEVGTICILFLLPEILFCNQHCFPWLILLIKLQGVKGRNLPALLIAVSSNPHGNCP
jgi:hypothetical protein